mgnify:CR=1 FL=1
MFSAIFGTTYSSIDPENVFTLQEVLGKNVESESSEMIEHIFEQFDKSDIAIEGVNCNNGSVNFSFL